MTVEAASAEALRDLAAGVLGKSFYDPAASWGLFACARGAQPPEYILSHATEALMRASKRGALPNGGILISAPLLKCAMHHSALIATCFDILSANARALRSCAREMLPVVLAALPGARKGASALIDRIVNADTEKKLSPGYMIPLLGDAGIMSPNASVRSAVMAALVNAQGRIDKRDPLLALKLYFAGADDRDDAGRRRGLARRSST